MRKRTCPHNPEYECFTCETERHDEEHPYGVDGCRSCKYRTINLSMTCTPTKTRSLAPPRGSNPAWERGKATDHRGVPYLDGKGNEIGVKQFAENRHKYEATIRRNKNAPAPSLT